MASPTLTDQERAAFRQEVTRNWALDYLYTFDNVPLQFIYRDRPAPVELTRMERRNKAITETLWLDAYHQYLVCNVAYMFTYRGSVLQLPLQIHQWGTGMFAPPAQEDRQSVATAEDVQASFDAWMASDGWSMADDLRRKPPSDSWQSLLATPDRTARIVSIMPVGNQVVIELISTWTEDGTLKETAWVVVLIYDVDGTVLQDRTYMDLSNWPSGRRHAEAPSEASQLQLPTAGIMDGFYDHQISCRTEVELSDLERRNTSIVETSWLDAQHKGFDAKLFHPHRFRLQFPLQKCSCNLHVATDIEALVGASSDRSLRLGLTYAKGSHVIAEGVVCWKRGGVATETPFITFLLLDEDGLIIRERRYLVMDDWPGGERMKARLGLGGQ